MDLLLRNFDNVMTFIINKRIDDELKTEKKNLASICFSPYQKLGKKDQEKHLFHFSKITYKGTRLIREIKGTCHVVRIICVSQGFPKKTSQTNVVLI